MPEQEEQVVDTNRLEELGQEAFGADIDDETEETVEVEETVERSTEESTEVAQDDDSQQETVEETSETPAVETPSENKWDKELQQAQQLNVAYEKLLEKHIANPTPETQKAVEKTKSKLDLIVEAKSEDVDPYSATQTVAKEVQSLQAARDKRDASSEETIALLREQIAATNDRQERLEFHQKNPAISNKYDDLVGELNKAVDDFRPAEGEVIPAKTWNAIVAREWKTIVDGANAKVAKAETKTEDKVDETVKKPVATNPVKSKTGTRRKPPPDAKAKLDELCKNAFAEE